MRKLILQEFLSLDGLAAGRGDSTEFVPASTRGDQAFGREQLKLMDAIDTILLGRVTYQMFAGYWPSMTEGPEKPFADRINAAQKVVFSKTLDRAPWGTWPDARIVKGDAAREVASIKQQSGKDMIVWGSISLAQSLIAAGLIDEYRLAFCPVVLGGGRPLFRDAVPPLNVKLSNARSMDLGSVLLTYLPKDARMPERSGARPQGEAMAR
jgi:dihydrofolate reductase